jgi:hypothetical protein
MGRRPTLETRPPVLIDAIVRTLIPPACREHVVGDLWERYRSPLQFIVDAARTVPFVIASQVRRTSTVGAVLVQAFLLSVAFLTASGRRPLAAVAPVALGLITLVLRDAYKHAISISAKQVAVDLIVGAAGVLLSQAVVAVFLPELLLSRFGLVTGVASVALLFALRLQNPGLGAIPGRVMAQVPTSLDALVTEVRLYERMGRRARLIEAIAGIAVAIFFIVPVVSSSNWFLRAGFGLASVYGTYVALYMARYQMHRMPDGLGFEQSLVHYRSELERQHRHVRTMWRWYLLPSVPPMFLIVIGAPLDATSRGRPAWPGLVMVAILVGVGAIAQSGSASMARKLRTRIDALKLAAER